MGLRIKRIGKSLLPFIENGSSILDIGSGPCELGSFLTSKGDFSYHGVDIIDYKVSKGMDFTKSGMPYPFKDKSFDIVLVVLTLHHMDDPEKGLKEAKRLARKKILILEDVPRNLAERFFMKVVDFIGSKFMHKGMPLPYNFLYDSEWNALFNKYDLKLNSSSKVYPLPFPRLNHFLYEVIV